MALSYEELNAQLPRILDFVERKRVRREPVKMPSTPRDGEYFTEPERLLIAQFGEQIATRDTWKYVYQYLYDGHKYE